MLSSEEAALLRQHFEVFTDTTNKLVAAQAHLQHQVRSLTEELESKNRQLESVNEELARKIVETENVRVFLDRVIDSMHTGLVVLNAQGDITRINRPAIDLLGWENDPPHRIEQILESGDNTAGNPLARLTGSRRSGEIRLARRNRDSALVRYAVVPLNSSAGDSDESAGMLFVFEDLSHLRLLEERVRRAGRLAALGELAAGVAHEMRNPLATMRGFLQLLPTEYGDPDFREECSTRLIREIDRLARLTDSLLELSRPVQPDHLETDLGEMIREVLRDQSGLCREKGIELVIELPTHIPPLRLDRDRLKQVLLNLVINARQAMERGGTLRVVAGNRPEIWKEGEEPTPSVFLSISDTGQGIETRYLDKLFDPFFTTKSDGTGLGLALCHRIVEEHGGVIRVETCIGKGSTFTLFFPLPSGDE